MKTFQGDDCLMTLAEYVKQLADRFNRAKAQFDLECEISITPSDVKISVVNGHFVLELNQRDEQPKPGKRN